MGLQTFRDEVARLPEELLDGEVDEVGGGYSEQFDALLGEEAPVGVNVVVVVALRRIQHVCDAVRVQQLSTVGS